MNKPYNLSLHIFRRDLRLDDNNALIEALQQSKEVIPCFIFDKRQLEANPYHADHCVAFMAQSLQELAKDLSEKQGRLYFFYGIAEEVVAQLLKTQTIDAVFINRDYTPFARARDTAIAAACERQQVAFHSYTDALLHEPEEVLKANGEPYTVFTPAFNRAKLLSIPKPRKNNAANYYVANIAGQDEQTLDKLLKKRKTSMLVKGGRKEGFDLLRSIKKLDHYNDIRNIPAVHGTTWLSAHHKFGTISIRETYASILKQQNAQHTLITELHWRDFFTHIGFHFPHVFQGAFHQRYDQIEWSNNTDHFRAWCEGRTGFPIVDAGMRELMTTGFMHNRVRMIVASFLTKDLLINWRQGEKYFAQMLTDYDPAVNNGNWQWAASTGCDAQPYFRIFNPWLQQEKFDPDCLYIKRFIPELVHLPPKVIHRWANTTENLLTNYPRPIVDHAVQSAKAKMLYQVLNKK